MHNQQVQNQTRVGFQTMESYRDRGPLPEEARDLAEVTWTQEKQANMAIILQTIEIETFIMLHKYSQNIIFYLAF